MADALLEPWPLRGTKPNEPTPSITKAIADATDQITAERVVRQIIKGNPLSRLTDKLTQVAGVAQRQTSKIEARADALIARETVIEQKTESAFAPHEALMSEAEKGLDAVEASLRLLSNDPLSVSGNSSG